MYKELKGKCKILIEKGICLGCNKLEIPEFTGNDNCEYIKEIERNQKMKFYTKVKARNFEYKRNW